jgi:hypothetical protein
MVLASLFEVAAAAVSLLSSTVVAKVETAVVVVVDPLGRPNAENPVVFRGGGRERDAMVTMSTTDAR